MITVRAYANGLAGNLPDTKVGTFSTELMNEATKRGWIVVSYEERLETNFSTRTDKITITG